MMEAVQEELDEAGEPQAGDSGDSAAAMLGSSFSAPDRATIAMVGEQGETASQMEMAEAGDALP